VASGAGDASVFTGATVVVAQLTMVPMAILAARLAELRGYWIVFALALLALPIRGVVAAVVFTALLMLIFSRPIGAALGLGAFMLVFYIPAGYYIDTMMWRKRERARIRSREEK
jgi:Na+/melibiose symporter-like transporter